MVQKINSYLKRNGIKPQTKVIIWLNYQVEGFGEEILFDEHEEVSLTKVSELILSDCPDCNDEEIADHIAYGYCIEYLGL